MKQLFILLAIIFLLTQYAMAQELSRSDFALLGTNKPTLKKSEVQFDFRQAVSYAIATAECHKTGRQFYIVKGIQFDVTREAYINARFDQFTVNVTGDPYYDNIEDGMYEVACKDGKLVYVTVPKLKPVFIPQVQWQPMMQQNSIFSGGSCGPGG